MTVKTSARKNIKRVRTEKDSQRVRRGRALFEGINTSSGHLPTCPDCAELAHMRMQEGNEGDWYAFNQSSFLPFNVM